MGKLYGSPGFPQISMDPTRLYPFASVYESADPVESRGTRRVPCASRETSYLGRWTDETNREYYDQMARVSETAPSSIRFTFRGKDIIGGRSKGRTAAKRELGMAFSSRRSIVMPPPPRPTSLHSSRPAWQPTWTMPSRSWCAASGMPRRREPPSDTCCSSIPRRRVTGPPTASPASWERTTGITNSGVGTRDVDMVFQDPQWVGDGKCALGYDCLVPDAGEAVRKWVAPHAGTVRIEGAVACHGNAADALQACILKNTGEVWPSRVVSQGKTESHDVTIAVSTGDAISFVVKRRGDQPAGKAIWDPAITYVDSRESPGDLQPANP